MTGDIAGLCEALAMYAAEFELSLLPARSLDHLVDAFVNWMACAVGGANHPTVDAVSRGLAGLEQGGPFRPIGRLQEAGLVNVAAIDCLSSAVLAYDDIHFGTGLHPTGPVLAALLALARREPIEGRRLLEALHVGMEIQCRVALAYVHSGAKLGWYATGVTGGIGAAAAVSRTLGADAVGIASAMALAAARACGNRGTHGSMAAAYVPSTGAETGLVAAFLTHGGLTCGTRALDGDNGLLELISGCPDFAEALAGLREEFVSTQTSFKPYPSGFVTHAAIDACLALNYIDRFDAADMRTLELFVSPSAHALGMNPVPRNMPQAQVSIQHWAALALINGGAGIAEADMRWIADPRVADLRMRISVLADPGLAEDQCRARASMRDGRVQDFAVDHARGSPGRPMSSRDVDAKAAALFRFAMSPTIAARFHDDCRGVLMHDDVAKKLGLGGKSTAC